MLPWDRRGSGGLSSHSQDAAGLGSTSSQPGSEPACPPGAGGGEPGELLPCSGPESVASSTSLCISILFHMSEVGRFNFLHLFVTFFGNILLYHSQIEE